MPAGDARQHARDPAGVLPGGVGGLPLRNGPVGLGEVDDPHVVRGLGGVGFHQLLGEVGRPPALDPLLQRRQLGGRRVGRPGQVVQRQPLNALEARLQGGGVLRARGDDHRHHLAGAAPVAAGERLLM